MSSTPRVGRFTYDVETQTWTWDEEVFRIHGLDPGAITPTTDYMLECKHPEDEAKVANVMLHATTTGEPFSVCYRLLAADGVERHVVLVCEGGVCDDSSGSDHGPVKQLDGYYIDLTDDFVQATSDEARDAVAASAEHRATIEQAKGSLMLAYGLDPDQAFAMLRWWSRNRNMKVRDIAEHITEVSQAGEFTHRSLRSAMDSSLYDASANTLTEHTTRPAHHTTNNATTGSTADLAGSPTAHASPETSEVGGEVGTDF